MKRLIIYFHYDARGRVDAPCRLAVRALLPYGRLLFVTNARLQREDRAWVQETGAELLERENTGFDVGAYRDALLQCGQEALCSYEEVVLMNYTLAGPAGSGPDDPLRRMFTAMDGRPELDFWGLTRHYAMRSRRFGGAVPEHLQSHFLAVRGPMLRDPAFWDYWQRMPLPRSYEESIIRHETRFTGHFGALGYRWDSYVDTSDLRDVFVNPIMACPRELIENRDCPFFKRRSFFTPYGDELRRTDGTASRELYEYLRQKTDYPVGELVAALLGEHPLADLARNQPWYYVLAAGEERSVDLESQGLRLLRFAPIAGDAVTGWYLRESAAAADRCLARAAALFARHPQLGVLSPAWPAWTPACEAARACWRQVGDSLGAELGVPVSAAAPQAPVAGWALVRSAALEDVCPDLQGKDVCWRLPLLAQKNGFYSAVFDSEAQAGARAEQLALYRQASQAPSAVARQLGRLAKHRILHR